MPKDNHKFIVVSLHDALAECSCGKWRMSCTGERTRQELKEEWEDHYKRALKAEEK